MSDELVSIITPTYNNSSLLKETIISVLKQTYKNFEHLIIDDGSTDNTKEVVESIQDKRIRYIQQNHSGIPAYGRNTGLKEAKGEFIAFLDHDDLWFPLKLEKQIKFLRDNKDLLVIASNGIVIPKKPYRKWLSIQQDKRVSFNEMLNHNPVINCSTIIKRELLDSIGLMDDSIGNYLPDYDYWLRVLKHRDNSILILKDILIKYRVHETNISSDAFREPSFLKEKYKRLVNIYKKHNIFDSTLKYPMIRGAIYQYYVAKKRKQLYEKEISVFSLLKDKKLKLIDKLRLLYYKTYLKSDNIFIKQIKNILELLIYKILS